MLLVSFDEEFVLNLDATEEAARRLQRGGSAGGIRRIETVRPTEVFGR